MAFLERWLEPFWIGMALHLWQSALFIAVLAGVALLLRRTSARLLGALYWVGILKLLLPLPLLGPVTDRVVSLIGSSPSGSGAEAGWTTVTVFMYPLKIDSASRGEAPALAFVLITFVWLLGTGFVLGRQALAGADRHRRSAGERLVPTLKRAGLRPAEVRISRDSPGPHVRGILRPVIVLPDTLVDGLDADELRAVLIHEREHLRRRDPLRYAVLALVNTLLWFYPPVWWLTRRIRETTEMACDEAVIHAGMSPATYCRSLARTLSLGLSRGAAVSPLGIFGHRMSFLRRRLERIRSERRFEAMIAHRLALVTIALVALTVSLLPLTPAAWTAHAATTDAEETALQALDAANVPVMLSFKQTPADKILDALGKSAGVDIRVMGDLSKTIVDLEIPRTPLVQALEQLGREARLKFRVVDPRTIKVYPVELAGNAGVGLPELISKVSPVYPEQAREQRLESKVILQAMIDREGNVGEVLVLNNSSGYEPFGTAAIEAVRQWRYAPATKDGKPVDIYFTVRIDFALRDSPDTEKDI